MILLPEIILLLAAIAHDDRVAVRPRDRAGPGARWPRRPWRRRSLALLAVQGRQTDLYSAVALNDDLAFYGRLVVLLTGLILLALAHDQPSDDRAGEFFGALLMINAGAMLVATANELVFLFVGPRAGEHPDLPAALPLAADADDAGGGDQVFLPEHLLLGPAALRAGLPLRPDRGQQPEGARRSLSSICRPCPHPQLGLIAVVFVMAGLCFRVAAVPFHFYAPDVYQGSPTVMAALLSWVPKAVGFLAMVRALTAVIAVKGTDDPLVQKAVMISWVIAAATMTLGNTVALLQDNLKRLLAYSSIAHAGYLMIGVTVAFANGPSSGTLYYGCESIFFYLVAYALMTLGAFGVIIALSTADRPVETVEDLAGLGSTQPLAGAGDGDLPVQPGGIPPLAGFWGKFEIFAVGPRRQPGGELRPVRPAGGHRRARTRPIGAYYYLRIVVTMYLRPARHDVVPGRLAGGPRRGRLCVAVAACSASSPAPSPGPRARGGRGAAVTHPVVREGEVAPAGTILRSIRRSARSAGRPRSQRIDRRISRLAGRGSRQVRDGRERSPPNRAMGLAASFQASVGVQPHSTGRRLVPGVPSGLCHDAIAWRSCGSTSVSLEARRAPLAAGLL